MNIFESIILDLIKMKPKNLAELSFGKRKIAKQYKILLPKNFELIKVYHKLVKNKRIKRYKQLEELLKVRPIRSLSGIVNISVLTKPYPCPGKCIYCPQEKGLPKSYLSGEPAVERAKKLNFEPYNQVQKRIEMLKQEGHPTDKIELRVIGATFSYYPKKYQNWFIKECFRGANNSGQKGDLEKEQKKNEKAKHRIVGISVETRPDLIDKKEILNLRKLGVTMVELGVQTIYDDILKKCQRGHSVKETIKATKLLKDAGFKVMYQIMPNLPGSNVKRDLECVKEIFGNPNFKPDWLKIYPCVVCQGTKLYEMWKKARYQSYSDTALIELLIKIKQVLPVWVRLARLLRDIPSQKIVSGCQISNLRQVVQAEMKKRGKICHCIRCREIREKYEPKEKVYLFRQDYTASDGKEIFLSYENKKRAKLYSLLRLRIAETAIIRELHTYGQTLLISSKQKIAAQHRGLGKKLVKQAEKIAKNEFGLRKIAVISGIGARQYFSKLKYKLRETYMVKDL